MPQRHGGEEEEARSYLYNMDSFIYSCNEIFLITQCVPGLGLGATDTKAVRHQGLWRDSQGLVREVDSTPVILNQGGGAGAHIPELQNHW